MAEKSVIVSPNDNSPIVRWLAELNVPEQVQEAIGDGNAQRLLRLEPHTARRVAR